MTNLLVEEVLTNYVSSLLRQHTVKQYSFVFYPV